MSLLTGFIRFTTIISLLIVSLAWTSFAYAAPDSKPPEATNKSDLNRDGAIDYDDLTIFSARFLEEYVGDIDWCAFVEATGQEADLYGRPPKYYIKHFSDLLSFASNHLGCDERSDLNKDGILNRRDLAVFSEQYAGEHFLKVDWCPFLGAVLSDSAFYGNPAEYYLDHYGSLLLYMQENYECTGGPPPVDTLALKNSPKALTRIAAARNTTGDYYVTDARVGSVFIYDSNLVLSQELKGLAKPLGIAVNSLGHILVGNDKRNNVEVYNPDNGELLTTFGESEIEMPVSITVDSADKVYVTDSRSNTVYVYNSNYQLINNIGKPGKEDQQVRSPAAAVLSADETKLFLLDRLNRRMKIYDLEGEFLGLIGPDERCGMMGCRPGLAGFTRLQAMTMSPAGDGPLDGKLHVLDIFEASIAVIDPQTLSFLTKYGSSEQLKSPMDLLVEVDRTLVVDGYTNKIEVVIP